MTKIFIAGSLTIKKIHPLVIERLNKMVYQNLNVVIGDAKGVDSSIQQELIKLDFKNVTVYCSELEPRNNLGSWPVKKIATSHSKGSKAFYTAKDIQMAKDADCGLMIWDSKSTGTLSNVIELLYLNKKSVVFINKIKKFLVIKSIDEFNNMISYMTESALLKAEDKIKLTEKILKLKNNQLSLI